MLYACWMFLFLFPHKKDYYILYFVSIVFLLNFLKILVELQANEGEGALPWDTFKHVFNLVQNGNQAFRENRFEEVPIILFILWCHCLYFHCMPFTEIPPVIYKWFDLVCGHIVKYSYLRPFLFTIISIMIFLVQEVRKCMYCFSGFFYRSILVT